GGTGSTAARQLAPARVGAIELRRSVAPDGCGLRSGEGRVSVPGESAVRRHAPNTDGGARAFLDHPRRAYSARPSLRDAGDRPGDGARPDAAGGAPHAGAAEAAGVAERIQSLAAAARREGLDDHPHEGTAATAHGAAAKVGYPVRFDLGSGRRVSREAAEGL